MKTLKQVEIEHVFVDLVPDILEQNIVYISKCYKVAIHLCLCGCCEKTVMFLDDGSVWWKLIEEKNNKISFIGSVGNYNFACKSHYIITNSKANFV